MVATGRQVERDRPILAWQKATWDEYVQVRDRYEASDLSRVKLFFHEGKLLVDDMGWEGIDHAVIRELVLLLLGFWIAQHPQSHVNFMGGCLLEKDGIDAASPDVVLYVGRDRPQRQRGETRKINLNQWRVPNLVGEVSDTTLTSDLDQKKRLYASLGIAEYWVIDVKGSRVFFFALDDQEKYRETEMSVALPGLSNTLLESAIEKVDTSTTNMDVALWFQQQITHASG